MAAAKGCVRLYAGYFVLGALVLGALGTGCSVATGEGAGGPSRSGGNELTGDEIRQSTAENLHDAIRQLRPRWLRTRGRASFTAPESTIPVVYANEMQFGSLEALYSMHVNDVTHVRYLSPADATTRFGTGHAGGAILVDLTR